MTTWATAYQQIKNHQSNNPTQPKCFMITSDDLQELYSQGTEFSGIRIYLGEDPNGKVCIYVIACDKDGNDYNIPVTTPFLQAVLPLKKDGVPCPVNCGQNNKLNS